MGKSPWRAHRLSDESWWRSDSRLYDGAWLIAEQLFVDLVCGWHWKSERSSCQSYRAAHHETLVHGSWIVWMELMKRIECTNFHSHMSVVAIPALRTLNTPCHPQIGRSQCVHSSEGRST